MLQQPSVGPHPARGQLIGRCLHEAAYCQIRCVSFDPTEYGLGGKQEDGSHTGSNNILSGISGATMLNSCVSVWGAILLGSASVGSATK
jgi:hypothetical protein